MDRLSMGEKLAGASAALLLLLSFLPMWAKFEAEVTGFGGSSTRFGGWSAATPFYTKLAFVLALVALVLVAMRAAAVDVQLPFPLGLSLLALGGLATLLLLITLLAGPVGDQGSSNFGGASFEYSRGLAMLLAWIPAAGIAAGGYMHMQNEPAATTATGGTLGGTPPPGPAAPGTTTPGTQPTPPPASGPTTPPSA
ncbi:MAG: hypothetical protein ACLGIB_07110 [Actinomycetota bacterium]